MGTTNQFVRHGIMMGWQLAVLQNVCPTVYALKKSVKKEQINKIQSTITRADYKAFLLQKHCGVEIVDYSAV